jgi:hypothetical protein
MSDELDLVASSSETASRCAQCAGPLPAPTEQLAIIHGRDGRTMTACSTACLTVLVVALAGRTREPAAGRRN